MTTGERSNSQIIHATKPVDGVFGPKTKQAVKDKDVEKRLGFKEDGIADIDVLKAIPNLQPERKHLGGPPLWIPFAEQPFTIRTKWTYEDGYPRGAVVHFTAGHDNPIGTLQYLDKVGYPCLVMGRNGLIYQAFPLNRGGCHSGTYHHNYSVGIEIVSAGRCTPVTIHGERRFAAWFHYDDQGNLKYPNQCFPESEMRHVTKDGSRREGWYQKYTGHAILRYTRRSLGKLAVVVRLVGLIKSLHQNSVLGQKSAPRKTVVNKNRRAGLIYTLSWHNEDA